MFLEISPDTHRDLQAVIESLQLNKSVNQLGEEILKAFLDSTVLIYNAAVESKDNRVTAEELNEYDLDTIPTTEPHCTNYYLSYAIHAYLGDQFDFSRVQIADQEINELLTKFRKNYPPSFS